MPTFLDRLEASRHYLIRDVRFVIGTFAASGVGYLGSAGATALSMLLMLPLAIAIDRTSRGAPAVQLPGE